MIARNLIMFILLVVVPDTYIYVRLLRSRGLLVRVVFWAVTALMLAWTLWLASSPHFIPQDPWPLFAYLAVLCMLTLPKAVLALTMAIGRLLRRSWVKAGIVLATMVAMLAAYGMTAGFNKFDVNRVNISSKALPRAFDGYRIALFSDAHVGSFATPYGRHVLSSAVDSINALGADVMIFAGDLQNARACEIDSCREVLSRLRAPDGVYAVLGNHDYPQYVAGTESQKAVAAAATIKAVRALGWQLLLNQHQVIHRGADSIAIGGMHNLGRPPFANKGDVAKTQQGLTPGCYLIMVQHDPSAWRNEILPKSWAQLTLSGHTHGGQINLLGLSPSMVTNREWQGMYTTDGRALFVTRGLGGLIPLRVGATAEVVLLTLRR